MGISVVHVHPSRQGVMPMVENSTTNSFDKICCIESPKLHLDH
jgi:hypothetical protein